MLLAALGYWVVGMPVGYLLGFHTSLGPVGVWIGLSTGLAVVGVVLAPHAQRRGGGAELVLAPTTVLHSVPWSLLPTVARRPVSVVPSAAWWARAAERRQVPAPQRVTLVAGPGVPAGEA